MSAPPAQRRSIVSSLRFFWLNAWFWTVAPLFTLLYIPAASIFTLAHFAVTWNRRKTHRVLRRSISYYGAGILRCGWPLVKVKFVDDSPHEKPPFVFVSNHRSSSDAFLMACLPFECIQVLNIWPAHTPGVSFFAWVAGYLRVREMPFEEFLTEGSKLLKAGCSVIAFPEGTRSGSTRLGPFHGSAFRLAMHNGVTVVPLAIRGNESIPPRGTALLNPGRIIVSKLPGLTKEDYSGLSAYELKTLVRERIEKHLAAEPA